MRVAAGWSLPLAVIVAALSAVTSLFARPQVVPPVPAERTVRDLVDSALIAPPELAADVLLKLVERGQIVDPQWKRDVIERAWSLAPRATYPFQIQPAVPIATNTDSDPGSLSAALITGLSTEGIQARVISQMAKLDPKATRDMFLQMSPPAAESPSCSADRYTSHRAYFGALVVASQTFSAEEARKGERARFLAEGMRILSSPEDFEVSLELLRSDEGLNNTEFALLMASWSEMLGRARFTDRLFSSGAVAAIATPLMYGGKRDELRGASLAAGLRALRSYFVTHARAARCGESRAKISAEEELRATFNRLVVQVMRTGIPPITAEEIKPESFEEVARVAVYTGPGNDKVWQMKLDYSHLRFGTEEQQAINDKEKRKDGMKPYLTIEQRNTPEWRDEALRFLNKLESWSREFGQSNREIFFQRAEWHGALVYIAPDGRLRQGLLHSYARFLASSPIERESPPEWAMWLNRLITSAEVPDRRAWLDQIEAAGDPAVAVYCQLARLSLLDSAR